MQHTQTAGVTPKILVISIIIGASVIHEILGPIASKLALKKAGEIC